MAEKRFLRRFGIHIRSFNGILVPTTRAVFAYGDNKQKVPGPPMISIHIESLAFS